MSQPQGFQRTIGLPTAISLVIATIIGSGIFMRPAEMAALLGSPILIFAVWIIAGFFTMLSAMVLAEVAAMLPKQAALMHSCDICMEISGHTCMAGQHLLLLIVLAQQALLLLLLNTLNIFLNYRNFPPELSSQ